jgi:hypothetical protein
VERRAIGPVTIDGPVLPGIDLRGSVIAAILVPSMPPDPDGFGISRAGQILAVKSLIIVAPELEDLGRGVGCGE